MHAAKGAVSPNSCAFQILKLWKHVAELPFLIFIAPMEPEHLELSVSWSKSSPHPLNQSARRSKMEYQENKSARVQHYSPLSLAPAGPCTSVEVEEPHGLSLKACGKAKSWMLPCRWAWWMSGWAERKKREKQLYSSLFRNGKVLHADFITGHWELTKPLEHIWVYFKVANIFLAGAARSLLAVWS